MNRAVREKLKWKCRRGLLELDLVLERFLRDRADELHDAQLARLDALLDLPDNDLWDIVSGRSERYDPGLADMVARLRTT
jgi:succinate dehydrogenase flavin-adding protein (antitoxin of CptAB toxin-antitoxin module)